MNTRGRHLCSARLLSLALHSPLHAVSPDYQPELFESMKLIYQDTFDGTLNADPWKVRQNTTWEIKDGVLTGSQSSKEFQEKNEASNGPSQAGLNPVIWLTGDVWQPVSSNGRAEDKARGIAFMVLAVGDGIQGAIGSA
jgi:hypothetical protein